MGSNSEQYGSYSVDVFWTDQFLHLSGISKIGFPALMTRCVIAAAAVTRSPGWIQGGGSSRRPPPWISFMETYMGRVLGRKTD